MFFAASSIDLVINCFLRKIEFQEYLAYSLITKTCHDTVKKNPHQIPCMSLLKKTKKKNEDILILWLNWNELRKEIFSNAN